MEKNEIVEILQNLKPIIISYLEKKSGKGQYIMKTKANNACYSKVVKKIITFKHKGKEVVYESLEHENLPINLKYFEILEGIKKESMKEFKVKVIYFDPDIESHISTWFVKPAKEDVAPKISKNLSNNKLFPAQQKQSMSSNQKGKKTCVKKLASCKRSKI